MYFVSIDEGAQVTIFTHFIHMWTLRGHIELFGTGLCLDRASHTKETLPDFREWCRVTRHLRVFRGLTGCQRTPRVLGRHKYEPCI